MAPLLGGVADEDGQDHVQHLRDFAQITVRAQHTHTCAYSKYDLGAVSCGCCRMQEAAPAADLWSVEHQQGLSAHNKQLAARLFLMIDSEPADGRISHAELFHVSDVR